jgi:hypothetical protein
MRIFQLRSKAPTKSGRHKPATCLACRPADSQFLAAERFRGHPFVEEWTGTKLNFGTQPPWDADFYFYGPGALVCSRRAMEALPPLEDEGEFLPVKLKGLRSTFFLYNSTNCRNYLNPRRTLWKASARKTGRRSISKHVFWAERIGDDCIFKILEEGAVNMYCIERTGDPCNGELKALVETEGLTGLAFRNVWCSGR